MDILRHLVLIDEPVERLRGWVSQLASKTGLRTSLCPAAERGAFPGPTLFIRPSDFVLSFSYPLAVGWSPACKDDAFIIEDKIYFLNVENYIRIILRGSVTCL